MAVKYTEEQLNKFNKTALIQLFLAQQEQFLEIDKKLQLLLEQVAVLNHNRFGRSTEKLAMDDQIAFMEVRSYSLMRRRQSQLFGTMETMMMSLQSPGPARPKENGKRISKTFRLCP